MKRVRIKVRENWEQKVSELGLSFYNTQEGLYWDESVCYSFSKEEIEKIKKVSEELHLMCLNTVCYIIDKNLFHLFSLNDFYKEAIIKSWSNNDFYLYGRFDFCVNKDLSEIKLLEYNADTPTSLLESAYIQKDWEREFLNLKEQDFSFHNKLVDRFKIIFNKCKSSFFNFYCFFINEDIANTGYLEICAKEAGFITSLEDIKTLKFNFNKKSFETKEGNSIFNMFKLYPWEWFYKEEYSQEMAENRNDINFVEPVWKMLLSNKAILPILWELFPEHPNLLEAYFDSPGNMKNYVIKPCLSREGSNIVIIENNKIIKETGGVYGDGRKIYQKLLKLPEFDDNYPMIGSWVVGDSFAGIGIRENNNLITDNFSRFVPSYIE